MTELPVPLTALSEAQRAQAHTRFRIIHPALEDSVTQAQVARTHNIPASTVQRWVKRYREKGLAGLADTAERSDKGKSRRLPPDAIPLIEALALQTPTRSIAAIHRQITTIAQKQGWNPPSYARVHQIIKNLDIAHLADVSRTTISRVLNHKPDVDPQTRERVLRIIEEQRFVPSTTAAGLAGGRSRLIGILIPAWAWPLIPDLTPGIVEVIKQTSYELVLYSINDEDIERDRSEVINRLLASQLTAGLLAIFPNRASQHLTRLYKQGFPVVTIDDQEVQITPWVSADNTTGAYTITRHLINLGHRRIAHIRGPSKYLVSHDRYNGYRQALLEADIPLDTNLVVGGDGDFLPPSGRAWASKLFELPPEKRPTAIFAASDQMAYGVLVAAEEYSISIPRDVALVGFDDDAPSLHTRPALTTIRLPYSEMGRRAIELLLSMVNELDTPTYSKQDAIKRVPTELQGAPKGKSMSLNNDPGSVQATHIQLPTTLIVRESCGTYRSPISRLSEGERKS